jgi:hypothetical protein
MTKKVKVLPTAIQDIHRIPDIMKQRCQIPEAQNSSLITAVRKALSNHMPQLTLVVQLRLEQGVSKEANLQSMKEMVAIETPERMQRGLTTRSLQ